MLYVPGRGNSKILYQLSVCNRICIQPLEHNLKGKWCDIAYETAACCNPQTHCLTGDIKTWLILSRARIKHVMSLCQNGFFFSHKILTEDVFVT
jgi:hypothetical protein